MERSQSRVEQEEQAQITAKDITELRELLQSVDEKLRNALIAPGLQNLHLLDGLTQPEQYERIDKRLRDDSREKKNIATYLAGELAKSPGESTKDDGKIFIESGSTMAHFSAELAQLARDGRLQHNVQVLTNNFLTLTSFGLGRVEVTAGLLESSYLAFVPFFNTRREGSVREAHSPRMEITEQHRARDANAYRILDQAIAEVGTIYMSASGFGFLLGPHVGSRANAIFKYCLLNNRARRALRLAIARPKAHYEGGSQENVEDLVYQKCYTIFNLGARLNSHASPDKLLDFCVMAGELRDSLPPEPERAGFPRSAPTELGLWPVPRRDGGEPESCEGYGLTGLQATWKSFLRDYPSGALEIIIGLGEESKPEKVKEELRLALNEANGVLSGSPSEHGWGLNRIYAEKPRTEDDRRVFHLVVTEP